MVWWGHPLTTGSEHIDYFFGLDVERKDAEEEYSEQLVRMEHTNTAPFIPIRSAPLVETEEARDQRLQNLLQLPFPSPRVRYALVIGRLFKIHPQFLDAVGEILLRSTGTAQESSEPVTLVVVFVAEKVSEYNEHVWQYLDAYTRRRGGCDDMDCMLRVRFMEFNAYVKLVVDAHVVLDTFPYGGRACMPRGMR